MRKNIKNDKVIRAMAIGISAMLMASSPLTALAAEGEGSTPDGNDDNNITVTPEAGIADQAQEAAGKAATEAKKAEDKAYEVKGEVQEGTKDAEAEVGKELADDIREANANIEAATSKDGASINNAGTDITNADTALGVAEANDKISDAELNKAADAAGKAGQIAEEAKDAMKDAQDKIDGQIEDIKGASTVEDANAAYEEAQKTADQAQADFDAKLVEYNNAKAAYDEAAEKLAASEKAYADAMNSADANAEAAAAELAKAQENAKALADALSAAKDAVDDSAAGAMDIVEKEELTQNDNGLNWRNEDKLFISIMKNYYLPEELGIKGDTTVVRKQGKDNNTMNYFEVTYTDENGATQKKYYNFLMDDKDAKGDQKDQDNIVIFEKRLVEINWEKEQETNPDQYVVKEEIDGKEVTSVISKDDLQAGIVDGSIVKVTDDAGKETYVKKNALTGSETFVPDSEITGTSTEDVTVDKDSRKESWSLDETTGNLIKTVTADVTTITYTDAKFNSADNNEYYDTEEASRAAAEAKKKELAPATSGKDATIEVTGKTDYTYTASGTYIPTFTKTVDVKQEVERKYTDDWLDKGVKTEEEAVAIATKNQEEKYQKQIEDDDDLYFIGISSNLAVTGATKGTLVDDSDFIVSGKVSATYAKVTKKTVDQSTLGAIWDDIKALFGKGETANKKLEDAARAAVEADGGIFVSANWDDWKLGKATIRYVAGVKKTSTEEKTDAKEAESALKDAMLAEAKKSGATGIYNVNTNTDEIVHTSYSYTIDYLQQTSKSTENQTIATETYADAAVLTGQIIQNLNYNENRIDLTQKDEKYRQFIENAKNLTEKYQKLLTEAEAAQAEVVNAQNAVDTLKDEIKKLKESRTGNLDALTDLEAKLTVAEQNRQAAEDSLNDINKKLDEAGDELEKVIDRLTPAPTPENPNGGEGGTDNGGTGTTEGGTDNGGTGTTEGGTDNGGAGTTEGGTGNGGTGTDDAGENDDNDDDNGEVAAVAAPVVLAPAPVAQATVVTQNQAAAPGVVQIVDEATPLADTVPAGGQETVQAGSDKEETKEAVNIEEEAVPLADVAVEDEQAKMSWWWLLIVMILGATGYEMYRKHNEKKLKAQADNAQDAE